MILDKQNAFSEAQTVTSSAASTNVIDLGNDDSLVQAINEKGRIDILVVVDTTYSGGTSVSVAIQTDDDEAFGSATTLYTSAAIVVASLVAGYQYPISAPAFINEQYIRLYYTVSGSPSAGALSAYIVLDRQTNGV